MRRDPAGESAAWNALMGWDPARENLAGSGLSGRDPAGESTAWNALMGSAPARENLAGTGLTGRDPAGERATWNAPTGWDPARANPVRRDPAGEGLAGNGPTWSAPARENPTGKDPTSNGPAGNPTILSPAELQRAARIKDPERAAAFVRGRTLVRELLGELLGTEPQSVPLGRAPCPDCGDLEHGPPALLTPGTAPRISLSHTAGYGILAVAGFPVGVDLEERRALDLDTVGGKALTPRERAVFTAAPPGDRSPLFFRCWTRKEAVLKAVGTGIVGPLDELDVRPERPGHAHVTAGVPGRERPWLIRDLALPAPLVGAVAVPREHAAGRVRIWEMPH
ncbi:4'-phosphopantetheinyl transferase superfamily protein [Streptomyces sp. NPDC047043]|uniref:4'-phosphopantetheinyl transferase family protein n=1 Tax=Streptomyces sp. NPDC047043 TaxID=3154497 RepID=UPI00340EC4BE